MDPHRMRALESVVGQLWTLSELVLACPAPSPSQDRSMGGAEGPESPACQMPDAITATAVGQSQLMG